MADGRLAGGNGDGAERVGDEVRRAPGRWTPAVHALLEHLERVGFDRAPRVLGFMPDGRERLSFLPGDTATSEPWPAWTRSDAALIEAADWLREYHAAVADFVPDPHLRWRLGGRWEPGMVIAHNDAGPHNAAWHDGRLAGFFDFDFAGPATRDWDLAYVAWAWVPLYPSELDDRRVERLRTLVAAYGAGVPDAAFLRLVVRRIEALAHDVERLAAAGDTAFRRQVAAGSPQLLRDSLVGLERLLD